MLNNNRHIETGPQKCQRFVKYETNVTEKWQVCKIKKFFKVLMFRDLKGVNVAFIHHSAKCDNCFKVNIFLNYICEAL